MGLNIHYSAVSLIVLFQESIKKYFIKLSYLEPTKLQLRNDRIVLNISNTHFNIILPIDISRFNTNRNSFFYSVYLQEDCFQLPQEDPT